MDSSIKKKNNNNLVTHVISNLYNFIFSAQDNSKNLYCKPVGSKTALLTPLTFIIQGGKLRPFSKYLLLYSTEVKLERHDNVDNACFEVNYPFKKVYINLIVLSDLIKIA